MGTETLRLTPRQVPAVDTRYRRIGTEIPVPESLEILEQLQAHEPHSMQGQAPVVWDRADGFSVFDRWGNQWLDFSSGVLVANAGHGHAKIKQAMLDQIEHGLIHNYCFASESRSKLVAELARAAPQGLDKVFLLTTGSETTECAIKLARTRGQSIGGRDKVTIVTFENAFHGRTMGAQMAGGIPPLKEWIGNLDPTFVQVPFPDGIYCQDTSFDLFLKSLEQAGVTGRQVAGVMSETYQGGSASFAPPEYMQKLRKWCDENESLLIFDEVQAGFGRTGRFWGFEHYDVVPDLIACGKGISSGMPLSALIGKADVIDQYPPGTMTSTHTGNPICVTAALANLEVIEQEGLVANAAAMGEILHATLQDLAKRFSEVIGAVRGKGLVAALRILKPGGTEPNPDFANDVVRRCVEKGLMLFAPVGYGGASIKIAPPLTITEAALREGLKVFEEAIEEATRK